MRTLIAWIVIILCVAFFAGAAQFSARHAHEESATGENVQLLLTSRYVVGARSLTSSFPEASNEKNTEAMLKTLAQSVKTPLDRLHAIAVIGEVVGPTRAVAEIDELSPTLPA